MYKILVISDTHHHIGNVIDLIGRISDLNHILHLGDLVADAMDIKAICDVPVHFVSGNCDGYHPDIHDTLLVEIKNKKFLLTHGHHYHVKTSLTHLEKIAKDHQADVALFGHTHMSHLGYKQDLLIMNPGSISNPRNSKFPSYGIIEIDGEGRIHGTLNDYKKSL
ncbi:metallophosphoesterase [Vallitaleaceae bacterium 9-2]